MDLNSPMSSHDKGAPPYFYSWTQTDRSLRSWTLNEKRLVEAPVDEEAGEGEWTNKKSEFEAPL